MQCLGKLIRHGSEAKPEVCRRIEAISRCEKDALLRGSPAKIATVLSTHEPGKRGHPAAGRDPTKRLSMFPHERIKLSEILRSSFLRPAQHLIAMTHCYFGQPLAGSIV